jgi:signal transduction histidine kinase
MPEDVDSAARRVALADLIQSHQREIESRWLAAVLADMGGRSIDLSALRDAISDYLAALAREIRSDTSSSTFEMRGNAAWAPVAQEHGVTRVRQGFDLEPLVHEFVILRRVLFEVARENGLSDARLADQLADLIEAGIAASVKSYVESRNYAARRAEAEHIGFLTHELKSPLTAATVVGETLRSGLPLNPAQDKQFDLLRRNLARLGDLIEGVLLVERFEPEAVKVNATVMPLGELLAAPLETARALAKAKGLDLELDCGLGLLAQADPSLTASALTNVLDNAVKYTDDGTVRVSCRETDQAIEVHVYDNCPGLSDEELRTIFEPFRRDPQSKKPGAGLGLAIAKHAVETQGGHIGADSLAERGCHFWFSLPKPLH